MFGKNNRYSFRKGVPKLLFTSQFLIVRYQKNAENVFHCSVVVGKKVDKRAVIRNKVKRLLVAIIKELVLTQTPYDMVIYARKGINGLEKEEIRENLKKALVNIQIL